MITLPNGCRCSQPNVFPSNWNKPTASTKKHWKIYYRFYDPTFTDKDGKEKPLFVEIKAGINLIKNLAERRAAVKVAIDKILYSLKVNGYNPYTGASLAPVEIEYEIDPETPFIEALRKALEKLTLEKGTRDDIRYVINGVAKAALQLRYDIFPICKISRRHLVILLEHCGRTNSKWSATRYNIYRAYLLMLFKKLVELEAVTANPVRDITTMKKFRKLRVVLTDPQRLLIDQHLQKVAPRFHKYVNLFFHSGGRGKELMQLRALDVDLEHQVYKTIVRKGRLHREVQRTIKDVAVEYWQFFLEGCASDQYLFGIDFKPAGKPMIADTCGRWWARYVKASPEKGGLGINVDMYTLKHLNTSETVDAIGDAGAAAQNAHTSTAMVRSVYDIKRGAREHQRLKGVNNKFSG